MDLVSTGHETTFIDNIPPPPGLVTRLYIGPYYMPVQCSSLVPREGTVESSLGHSKSRNEEMGK